jgi:hypothetical protein
MSEPIKTRKLADVLAEDFSPADASGLPKLAGDLKWFIKKFPSMSFDMVIDFAANYPIVKETEYAGSPTEYLVKKYGKAFVDGLKEGIDDKDIKASWVPEHTITGSAEGRKAAFKINKDLTANTRAMLGGDPKVNAINTKPRTVFQPKSGSKAKAITLDELLGNIKKSKVQVGKGDKAVYKKEKMYEGFSPSLKSYSEQRKAQAEANKKKRAEAAKAKAEGKAQTGRTSAPAKPVEKPAESVKITPGKGESSKRPKK